MRGDTRPLDVAQHEAAHVVVGVALGLRLHSAALTLKLGETWGGHAWFPRGSNEALAIMYAAGVAWDRALGIRERASLDLRLCRERVTSRAGVLTCVRAAGAMLAALGTPHARVTRLLLERDISGSDIAALVRGARARQVDD